MTLEELSRCIGYDIEGNQELMDALQRNPLIEFDYPELRYKVCILDVYYRFSHQSMQTVNKNYWMT